MKEEFSMQPIRVLYHLHKHPKDVFYSKHNTFQDLPIKRYNICKKLGCSNTLHIIKKN
jgi:hypothetical protein